MGFSASHSQDCRALVRICAPCRDGGSGEAVAGWSGARRPGWVDEPADDRSSEGRIPCVKRVGEGKLAEINARLRETPFLEVGAGQWNVDEMAFYDVPAVLDYVKRATGRDRVNWVGHSLGGMLIFPYLELAPEAYRIVNFVG